MREWEFENCIKVIEEPYNYDVHCLKVHMGNEYLGAIYPDTIEDMEEMARALDSGEDPVTGEWEDGMGNICQMNGWGYREETE